ncbi:MAG: hypothetical protein HQK76_15125 [Desulfobacterales bacterium]|nr:hypothetical protein [Desulfobacterales bacterium]
MKSIFLKSIFFLIISLFICSKLYAYVLTGSHIFSLLPEKTGKIKKVIISQKKFVYGETSGENSPVEISEKLMFSPPDNLRSESTYENNEKIHIRTSSNFVTVINGMIANETQSKFEGYTDFILYRSRPLLEQSLILRGVNLSISSLGRFQDMIAFIIGSDYLNLSNPQLWVEKNNFTPIRWIIEGNTTEKSEPVREVRYLQWSQIDKQVWYPMVIEFYSNGNKVQEIAVISIDTKPTFSDDIFNIPAIISKYPKQDIGVPTEINKENEIDKKLENFKNLFD